MSQGLWEILNPEKHKAMKQRDYLKHKEAYKKRAKNRADKLKNDPIFRQQARDRNQLWYAKNRKRESERSGRVRARRMGAKGTHTTAQWTSRVQYYGWRCFYCNILLNRSTLTKDHRIPLSKKGTNFASNLVPACQWCNTSKKDRKYPVSLPIGASPSLL